MLAVLDGALEFELDIDLGAALKHLVFRFAVDPEDSRQPLVSTLVCIRQGELGLANAASPIQEHGARPRLACAVVQLGSDVLHDIITGKELLIHRDAYVMARKAALLHRWLAFRCLVANPGCEGS